METVGGRWRIDPRGALGNDVRVLDAAQVEVGRIDTGGALGWRGTVHVGDRHLDVVPSSCGYEVTEGDARVARLRWPLRGPLEVQVAAEAEPEGLALGLLCACWYANAMRRHTVV